MDLCRLDNFENISEMRKKTILSPDGKKIGRITDVIFDSNFQLHSFVIGGSFWEEFRETLGIIDDIDAILPVDNILEITSNEIQINLTKDQLKSKFDKDVFPENIHTYSDIKRKVVRDSYDEPIGKICNMIFLPCGEAAFILHCGKTKEYIPKGITSKWDLLLPTKTIKTIKQNEIVIDTGVKNLELALNDHILTNEEARNYLNSLQKKDTAEIKAIMRNNPGYFM